jgi:hypothetical protein
MDQPECLNDVSLQRCCPVNVLWIDCSILMAPAYVDPHRPLNMMTYGIKK